MRAVESVKTIIKNYEKGLDPKTGALLNGPALESYKCPAGIWTIGYGLTSSMGIIEVVDGLKITEDQANAYLDSAIKKISAQIIPLIHRELSDEKFSSLISFVFNLGIGSLSDSTLLKRLNDGDFKGAANEFLKWDKYKDKDGVIKESEGLLRRRFEERTLFLSVPN